jgi:hypothetical protein
MPEDKGMGQAGIKLLVYLVYACAQPSSQIAVFVFFIGMISGIAQQLFAPFSMTS